MKIKFHRDFLIVFIVIIGSVFFYEIIWGSDHRLFEQRLNMPYPLTPEQKENARMVILLKMLSARSEAVNLHNKANEYRLHINTLPSDSGAERAWKDKLSQTCDYLESVSREIETGQIYDMSRLAYNVGMTNELLKFHFIELE